MRVKIKRHCNTHMVTLIWERTVVGLQNKEKGREQEASNYCQNVECVIGVLGALFEVGNWWVLGKPGNVIGKTWFSNFTFSGEVEKCSL